MITESKLIFIISQPRAGSTLTQKLLSNNDFVDTVSEPWLLLPLLSIYRADLINAKYNYSLALNGFFDYLKKKDVDLEFRRELKEIILKLYRVSNESQYFIDKTPRYYEILSEIIKLFPEAKFLVLKRNPFASLHSMISIWSGGTLKFKLLKSFYRDFLIAPFLIQDFCDNYGHLENILEVKYENIVSDPEGEGRRIYNWLGIPFSQSVLNIGVNEKVKGMYGDDAQKDLPLNKISSESIDSWKDTISKDPAFSFFFNEYQNYLTESFIKKYGYNHITFSKERFGFRQNKFKEFLEEVKLRQPTRLTHLKKIIKTVFNKRIR